jgi:two-component system cell cycle sensor histidine kinase/response regulator CckA
MLSVPRILIVEDQNIVAMDIQNRLINLNYVVTAIASSGAGAIKRAEETKPDLVLMDIMLKGDMDGIGAAQQIRARLNIPVVYLTAYADSNTLQRAKITEPFGYILKPFEERELHTTIEMALYRHKMEKQLKEREQWFSTTLNSIGDAVITTDKKGFITFLNPVAEQLTGWKQSDVLHKKLNEAFNIIYEDTRESVAEDPVSLALNYGHVESLPNRAILISRDGTERLIGDSVSPIRDENKEITGVVLIFRDVTDKRRLQEEIQKVQKLESIGKLAGGIAHDFNNILTAIVGNISLAKMKVNNDDRIFDLLDAAENAAFHARDLTLQLLTFSKGGTPVKKITPIHDLLKNATKFALRGSNVKCNLEIDEDLWPVEIDEGQINQVFNNVIINADQAMQDGGTITIRAENFPATLKNTTLPLKNIDYVKISIEDEGPGIPEKDISKIFDPYFSTKPKGSGLGLSISFSIITKHEGIMTAESKPGEGTAIYIYLPVFVKELQEKDTKVYKNTSTNQKILVMDDEQMLLDLGKRMLSSMGYRVEVAKNGNEALELYEKSMTDNDPFNLVIMDLTIPGGMGGKEAIVELLKIDPYAKVIVCSGYSNDPIIANFRDYGFVDALTKPFKISELDLKINELLGTPHQI